MVQLECVRLVAAFANSRLNNLALLDEPSFFSLAVLTCERCFLHFRNDVRASDDNASQSNQLFNVSWVQLSNSVDLPKVEGPHLYNCVQLVIVLRIYVWVLGEGTVLRQ